MEELGRKAAETDGKRGTKPISRKVNRYCGLDGLLRRAAGLQVSRSRPGRVGKTPDALGHYATGFGCVPVSRKFQADLVGHQFLTVDAYVSATRELFEKVLVLYSLGLGDIGPCVVEQAEVVNRVGAGIVCKRGG